MTDYTPQQGPLDPGPLVDGDLELVLAQFLAGNPAEGLVPMYRFQMRHTADGSPIGEIDLRIALTPALYQYGGNLGYYVEPDFRGRRYAARSVRLLFGLARAHGLDALWITCAPDNLASRRTCELVGGVLVDIVPLPRWAAAHEPGRKLTCRYRVDLMEADRQQQADR